MRFLEIVLVLLVVMLAAGMVVVMRTFARMPPNDNWIPIRKREVRDARNQMRKQAAELRDLATKVAAGGSDARQALDAAQSASEELRLVGRALDESRAEVARLRKGEAVVIQAPLLRAMVWALATIEQDVKAGTEASVTLQGLEAEISERLEAFGVVERTPTVGDLASECSLIDRSDPRSVVKYPSAPEPELAGTIAEVERPAFVLNASGEAVVIQHAVVHVYSDNQDGEL